MEKFIETNNWLRTVNVLYELIFKFDSSRHTEDRMATGMCILIIHLIYNLNVKCNSFWSNVVYVTHCWTTAVIYW